MDGGLHFETDDIREFEAWVLSLTLMGVATVETSRFYSNEDFRVLWSRLGSFADEPGMRVREEELETAKREQLRRRCRQDRPKVRYQN